MITEGFVAKVFGAIVGSSFAVVVKDTTDSNQVIFKRLIIGTIIGFIFSPILIDYMNWERSLEYWIASSVLAGLIGYFIIVAILNTVINIELLVKKAKK